MSARSTDHRLLRPVGTEIVETSLDLRQCRNCGDVVAITQLTVV